MSEEASGLLATASAAPETTAQQPDIAHTQKPVEAATAPTGDAWAGEMTKNLYKDGKPDYGLLPQKFWEGNNPKLDKALTAYSELEKKFARGDHKAPEAYSMDVLKSAGVPDDDPLAGSFANWAKEQGISQDAFNKLAQSYLEVAGAQQAQAKINIEQERQKLGPQADRVIEDMVGWAKGLVQKGIWGPDDFDEFKVMGGTAQGLRALQKVREFYGDIQKIPVSPQDPAGRPSKEELQAMVGDPRYAKDPAFRMKVERLFEETYG